MQAVAPAQHEVADVARHVLRDAALHAIDRSDDGLAPTREAIGASARPVESPSLRQVPG